VNEAAFELHAQLATHGSISRQIGEARRKGRLDEAVDANVADSALGGQPWQPRRALPRRSKKRENNNAEAVLLRSYCDTALRAKAYLRVKR
jgi:hypothetical protein